MHCILPSNEDRGEQEDNSPESWLDVLGGETCGALKGEDKPKKEIGAYPRELS